MTLEDLRKKSISAIKDCPSIFTVSLSILKDQIKEIANFLNIKVCTLDGSSKNFDPSIFLKTDVASQPNSPGLVSCELLTSLASLYLSSQNNIACIINSSKSDINTKVFTLNNVLFENSEFNCTSLNIEQGATVSISTDIKISDTDSSNISKHVSVTNQGLADLLNSVLLKNPQLKNDKEKTINDMINALKDKNTETIVKDAVANIDIGSYSANTLLFKNASISAATCNITQNIQINIIASSILRTSMSSAFSSAAKILNDIERNKDTSIKPPMSPAQSTENHTNSDGPKDAASFGLSEAGRRAVGGDRFSGASEIIFVIVLLLILIVVCIIFFIKLHSPPKRLPTSDPNTV